MIPSKELEKRFDVNGFTFLYDINRGQYRIRWQHPEGTYSIPYDSGKCKRTFEFREEIINAFVRRHKK